MKKKDKYIDFKIESILPLSNGLLIKWYSSLGYGIVTIRYSKSGKIEIDSNTMIKEFITKLKSYEKRGLGNLSISTFITILREWTENPGPMIPVATDHKTLSIKYIDISNRLYNILRVYITVHSYIEGVNLGDIIKYSAKELLELPGFGKASLRELRNILIKYDLTLKTN